MRQWSKGSGLDRKVGGGELCEWHEDCRLCKLDAGNSSDYWRYVFNLVRCCSSLLYRSKRISIQQASSCDGCLFNRNVKVTRSFTTADSNKVPNEPTALYRKAPAKLPAINVSRKSALRFLGRLFGDSNMGSMTKSTQAAVAIAVVIS